MVHGPFKKILPLCLGPVNVSRKASLKKKNASESVHGSLQFYFRAIFCHGKFIKFKMYKIQK